MATITQAERMMRLETNVENLDKKLETGFADVKTDIKTLSTTVQQLVPTLVTQAQLADKVNQMTKEIGELKLDLLAAKRKNTLTVWLTSTLSAVLAVILTVLVQEYFKK